MRVGFESVRERACVYVDESDLAVVQRQWLAVAGAVGQPRDGDNRSSYAILDLEECTVEFRRVSYDLARAQLRSDAAVLPSASGARLALGA